MKWTGLFFGQKVGKIPITYNVQEEKLSNSFQDGL